MNILFIGPYRQNDGWGYAAKDYVRALESTGCNLAIRPIYMSAVFGKTSLDEDLVQYEHNTFKEYDLVIQNVLPSLITQTQFRTASLAYYETYGWPTNWKENLQTIDINFTCSNFDFNGLYNDGIKNNYLVPMPCNFSQYEKPYEPLNIGLPKPNFLFYFIGELNSRKGLEKLLIAFHREFNRDEDVGLLIKTNKIGVSPEEVANRVQTQIMQVKEKMRLYPNADSYKAEIIITESLTHEEMMRLHTLCDCFVLPSSGESFSRPSFDALVLGKTPIINKNSGMSDFVTEQNGYLIESHKTPVYVDDPPFAQLYTSRETWFAPSILSLQKHMRTAYENRNKTKKTPNIQELKNKYSYEAIGQKIITYVTAH